MFFLHRETQFQCFPRRGLHWFYNHVAYAQLHLRILSLHYSLYKTLKTEILTFSRTSCLRIVFHIQIRIICGTRIRDTLYFLSVRSATEKNVLQHVPKAIPTGASFQVLVQWSDWLNLPTQEKKSSNAN